MRDARRFQRGSGCYKCGVCGKLTRDNGQGDSVNVGLCGHCYEVAGLDNYHSDEGHDGELKDCQKCRVSGYWPVKSCDFSGCDACAKAEVKP